MSREELMKLAMKAKNPIKKSLYKSIVAELDREQDFSKKALLKVVKGLIKSTKLLHQDDVTEYELKLLHDFLPEPIDLHTTFRDYTANATAEQSMGACMKYFKDTFDGRYDAKTLSMLAKNWYLLKKRVKSGKKF